MMRRYGFLVMAAVLLLAGCGKKDAGSAEQTAKPASGETFTLKIGNTVSDIDPFNVAYREFEEEVEKASEGRIQVELFTRGSIGETDADRVLLRITVGNGMTFHHPIVLPTFPECLSIMYMEFHI